jgi:D-alanyl-D-alanine carboxypeptidase
MTRVRSYAGYLTAQSGREFAFCILVSNFSGSSRTIVAGIEQIISETILNN